VTTTVDCIELRGRLAEYAVSTLPERERRDVERHLEWCAGCRKEAGELKEAAALAGLSLGPADPPAKLEDRVVTRIRGAAQRHRPGRRRVLRAVTLVAAVVGLVAVVLAGTLFAHDQSTTQKLLHSKQQVHQMLQRLGGLMSDLRAHGGQPDQIARAALAPTSKRTGDGGALLVTSSSFADEVVVLVGGLDLSGAPYRVWLTAPSRRPLLIGPISLDDAGGGMVSWFARNLKSYRSVQIRDGKGRLVLHGTFAGSPS
jgi:hypothetical protein